MVGIYNAHISGFGLREPLLYRRGSIGIKLFKCKISFEDFKDDPELILWYHTDLA